MLSSISFPSIVPGMLRNFLLAALLCSLALAETPKPPTTLTELKASPAGLTSYSGDIREEYGQYPVTAVYVRESERGQVSYLLYGDKVFGYLFRFQKAGDDTQLWHDGINAFLNATFPAESFQQQSYSVSTWSTADKNIHYRTQAVLNTKAYEEAMQSYHKAEDERLLGLVTGSGAGAGTGTARVEKDTAPGTSRTLADYLKSFPETKPATVDSNGVVAGFEGASPSLKEFPYDALHHRQAGTADLLIASRKGIIIGYLAQLPVKSSGSTLEFDTQRAGLATAFPDPLFSREENLFPSSFFCTIKDRAAFATAREGHLADEGAKLKSLLNP